MGWEKRFLLLALILFLSGCATNPIDFSKSKTVPQEEAVVFGRVNVIYKDEPKVWGKSYLHLACLTFLFYQVAHQRHFHTCCGKMDLSIGTFR